MRAFIAWLNTETNSFSPLPTSYRSFDEGGYLVHQGRHTPALREATFPVFTFRRLAEARGWQVVESLSAVADPGGPTVRPVYEGFRQEILDDLRAAWPVEVVFLDLHGAMAADGYDDCEGDLLAHIRQIVGPAVPIGAVLDPHCHLTEAMVQNATVLVMAKEYPHTDLAERAGDAFRILAETAAGKVRPCMSVFDCRMITVALHTTREPWRSLVGRMTRLESEDDVLSISLCHGMQWGDVPEMGARVLVVTDSNPARGQALAQELGRELWTLRDHTVPDYYLGVDEALDRALEVLSAEPGKPVVIADTTDNPGGGAPGDSTFILRALLDRGIQGAAVATIWDPIAAGIAADAGEGARLALRIGGKMGPCSGDPVDVEARVIKVTRNATQTFGAGNVISIGDAAVVRVGGIDIILNTTRRQVYGVDCLTNLGIQVAQKRIIVVKSSQHFYASFAPLAAEVLYCIAPGTLEMNIQAIPYRRIDGNKWPLVEDPFAVQDVGNPARPKARR